MDETDTVLTKKAYTILCAAGLNPAIYNSNKFNNSIAVWLVRGYIAIFKSVPQGLILSPISARDDESNCQLIINELNRQNLLNTKFNEGNVNSQLVDALYKKYMIETGADDGLERKDSNSSMKRNADINNNALPEINRPRQSERSNSLSGRLQKIEESLKFPKIDVKPKRKRSKGKSKKILDLILTSAATSEKNTVNNEDEVKVEKEDENLGIDADNADSDPDNSGFDSVNLKQSSPKRRKRPSSAPSVRLTSHNRPQSPAVLKVAERAAKEALCIGGRWNIRRNDTPLEKAVYESEESRNARISKKIDFHQAEGRKGDIPGQNDDTDPAFQQNYTYDIMTGRRKLLTDDEDNYFHQNRENREKKDKPKSRPTSPGNVRPDWPGLRTQASALEWVRKKKEMLEEEKLRILKLASNKLFTMPLYKALFLPSYLQMDSGDILISVEHCVNCTHHNTTLRHDCHEYVKRSDEALKICAEIVFEMNLNVRVGVYRFFADVTASSQVSDAFNRIGACEIQIAYKTPSNGAGIMNELIHSKLCSRCWPSKVALKKRIQAFITKIPPKYVRINKQQGDEMEEYSLEYSTTASANGMSEYPIRSANDMDYYNVVQWNHTPLGSSGVWSYQPRGVSLGSIGYPPSSNTDAENEQLLKLHEGLPYVQWVYDAKPSTSDGEQADTEKVIREGEFIYLSKYSAQGAAPERWPMVGKVLRNVMDKDNIFVASCEGQLKYDHRIKFSMPIRQCNNITHAYHELWKNPSDIGSNDPPVPLELFTLIYYARIVDQKQDIWNSSGNLKDNKLFIADYFRLIRELVVYVEGKYCKGNADDGLPSHLVFSPKSNSCVDLQLSYSDTTMSWICDNTQHAQKFICSESANISGATIDVSLLENSAVIYVVSASNVQQLSEERVAPITAEEVKRTITLSAMQELAEENLKKHVSRLTEDGATPEGGNSSPRGVAVDVPAAEPNHEEILVQTHEAVTNLRQTIKEVAQRINQYRSPKRHARRTHASSAESYTAVDTSSLMDIFHELDTTNTGELDIKEFVKALERMGVVCTPAVLESISASFDADGNGRISLEEFVEFVSYVPEQGRELGELWNIIRSGLKSLDAEISGVESELPSVSQLHDMFALKLVEREMGGNYILGNEFLRVLDMLSLSQPLVLQDKKLLLKTFGDKNCEPDAPVDTESPRDNYEQYFVRFVDFLCWLQPVDVSKVVKRIGRFIKAALVGERGMEDANSNVISDIQTIMKSTDGSALVLHNKTMIDANGNIAIKGFQDCIDVLGLPISSAEIRALIRYIDSKMDLTSGSFLLTEVRNLLNGQLPNKRNLPEPEPELADKSAVAASSETTAVATEVNYVPLAAAGGAASPPPATSDIISTKRLVPPPLLLSSADKPHAIIEPVHKSPHNKLPHDLTPDPPRALDLEYLDLDVQFNRIEVQCGHFKTTPKYDKMQVELSLAGADLVSGTSALFEKGLIIRSFDVEDKWKPVCVSADVFKEDSLTFTLNSVGSADDQFKFVMKLPLYLLMKTVGKMCSISKVVLLPVEVHEKVVDKGGFSLAYSSVSSATAATTNAAAGRRISVKEPPPPQNYIKIVMNFIARETKQQRASALDTSMLALLKFNPLPLDDDEDYNDISDDDRSITPSRTSKAKLRKVKEEDDESVASHNSSLHESMTNLSIQL